MSFASGGNQQNLKQQWDYGYRNQFLWKKVSPLMIGEHRHSLGPITQNKTAGSVAVGNANMFDTANHRYSGVQGTKGAEIHF